MRKPKILVIDDDREIAHLIEVALGALGYQMEVAYDGRKGLALALAAPPDLVLLDYLLPGKDGFDCLRDMRSEPELKLTPVIMITGRGISDVVGLAIQYHVIDFIVKPFEIPTLTERVKKILPLT